MAKLKQLFLFCLFTISILWTFNGCRKQDDFSKYAAFPLELTIQDVSSGTKLKWNKINTSDFVQYIVVRNTVDTTPDIKSTTNLSTVPIFARITDPTKTELIDLDVVTSKTYYRVFAQLGNRFIGSVNVASNSSLVSVPGNFYEFAYNLKRNYIYMLDRNSGFVNLYDVNKGAVVKSIRVALSTSNYFYMVMNQYSGADELLIQGVDGNGNATINVHDPVTLELKDQISTGFSSSYLYSYCSDYNTGILYAYSSPNNAIRAISRGQKTILSTNTLLTSGYNLRFKKITDSKIIGMPYASGNYQLLQFGNSGQMVAPVIATNVNVSSTSINNPFVVSPFENVFIYGFNGQVFDKDMKTVGQLATSSINTYRDFAFSDDATKIFAATSSSLGKRQLDVFTNPGLSFVKSIVTKTFSRNIFYIGNNQVLNISDGFDNQTGLQSTIFEKIDVK
jgi:hypothetical protein